MIDRGTPIGFSNIARARQLILDMEGTNAHVVAPVMYFVIVNYENDFTNDIIVFS